jgi:hypothetical protein
MIRFGLMTLLLGAAASVFGWDGTVVTDVTPTAALVTQGNGSPIEAQSTRTTTQAVVSNNLTLSPGWTFSGTGWLLLDSLPTSDPTQVPANRLAWSSRVLQLDAQGQLVPGVIFVDLGKQIIHPSAGFFKTPLNLLSRGAAGNTPQQTPAASPQWEEGWWGAKVAGTWGDWTLEDFVAPPLSWSDAADKTLQELSAQQPDLNNQLRVDGHIDAIDLQGLALVTVTDPGRTESVTHVQTGVGIESSVGDHLAVHAEATLADSLDRLQPSGGQIANQSVAWVPRALAGLNWSVNSDVSFLAEYEYNGLGFFGSEYTSAVQAGSAVSEQFGAFSLARNYAFFRLADNFTSQITGQGWTEVNLQDASGQFGLGLAAKYDQWGLSGSITETWGADRTEAHELPYLWQLDAELQFYF